MVIRQHFLQRGEDANLWRLLYQDPHSGRGAGGDGAAAAPASGFTRLLLRIPLLKQLAQNQVMVREDGLGGGDNDDDGDGDADDVSMG